MSTQAATIEIPRKRSKQVTFTAYVVPEPQGSIKSFIMPNKEAVEIATNKVAVCTFKRAIYDIIFECAKRSQAILTSDNNDLKKFRQHVGKCAEQGMWNADLDNKPVAKKQIPVEMICTFYFERPESAKKRLFPSVRPDIDKLLRAVFDSCKGILYEDDAQIVSTHARKEYGTPPRVEVSFTILEQPTLF